MKTIQSQIKILTPKTKTPTPKRFARLLHWKSKIHQSWSKKNVNRARVGSIPALCPMFVTNLKNYPVGI